MESYIALLRAVNLGGRNKVAMRDLRELVSGLGHHDVTTYLQSGNVLFTSDRSDRGDLAREIQERIAEVTGVDAPVLLRTQDELAGVIDANPEPAAVSAPTQLHVAFLSAEVPPERLAAIDTKRFAPDRLHPGRQVVYLWYENGAGRSKLTNAALERLLEVRATARNWKTVTALLDRASEKGLSGA